MDIQVKNIDYKDEQRIIKELKDLDKDEIINYIKALKRVIEGQKETNKFAIKKIKELSRENIVSERWHKPEEIPEYYKPIIMLIETKIINTIQEIYIAGYYHSDHIYCESCGGDLNQEFDNYKLKSWSYIVRQEYERI